ncbi:MAG: hypothetical protein KDK64_06010 [Chlamydiia bacterium]|nr:hypothetical protein [Chlamydiia bacterium]
MAEVNPILLWNRPELERLIAEKQQEVALYTTLSKASHVILIFFGFSCLTTFGMTDPSYTAITGTLIMTGYGPACDVSVEAWQALATHSLAQIAKYREIHRKLGEHLDDVPELKGNTNLIAQWHALTPLEEIPYVPPEHLLNLAEGNRAFDAFTASMKRRAENGRKKISRAYLIHVANHNRDSRKISKFGKFHFFPDEYLALRIDFVFFRDVRLSEIEAQTPAELARTIFG